MPVYLVAHANVLNVDEFRKYGEVGLPSMESAGARILGFGPAHQLEGTPFPNHNVVVEFPSMEEAKAWYASEEYQRAVPLRQHCSKDVSMGLLRSLPPGFSLSQ